MTIPLLGDRQFHTPEPKEILDWLASRATMARDYLRDPRNQVVWGIVLLAALLRLVYLDLIEFKATQIRWLTQAAEILDGSLPATANDPMALVAPPPLLSYLLTIPVLLGRDPRIAVVFLGLANALAVFGLYAIANRHYGSRVAILASLFLAVSPWQVILSRRIGPDSLLVPLAILLLYGLCSALYDRDPWGWVLSAIALGLLMYASFLSVPLLLVFVVLVIIYFRRVSWPHLLLGICLILILFVPYLYHQNLYRLADLGQLVRRIVASSSAPASGQRALQYIGWAVSGLHLDSLVGPAQSEYHVAGAVFSWPPYLLIVACLVSLLQLWILALRSWSRWRSPEDPAKFVLPAVWLWVPLLLLMGRPGAFDIGMLLALVPVMLLSAGISVAAFLDLFERGVFSRTWWGYLPRLGVWLATLAVILWQAFSVVHFGGFVASHDTSESYGVPYRFWYRTAGLAQRVVAATPAKQLWGIVGPTDILDDDVPMILRYLIDSRIEIAFMEPQALLLPAERPGVYLLVDPDPMARKTLTLLQAEERGLVHFPGRASPAQIYVADARPVAELLGMIQTPGSWGIEGGPQMIGYDLDTRTRPGPSLAATTFWTFQGTARLPAHSYGFSLGLNSAGNPVPQCTGLGLPERYWKDGLLLQQTCLLSLPTGGSAEAYALTVTLSGPGVVDGVDRRITYTDTLSLEPIVGPR